jgi:hypothetical protein
MHWTLGTATFQRVARLSDSRAFFPGQSAHPAQFAEQVTG